MLPTDLFADYQLLASGAQTLTESGIFIPLDSLTGLTAAEANATTGDGRELLRALVMTAYESFASLPTPPSRMAINYSENLITESRREVLITTAFNVIIPTAAYQMEAEPSA